MIQKKEYPYQDFFLRDLDGEKWGDIPFLDGAYRLSSYGIKNFAFTAIAIFFL